MAPICPALCNLSNRALIMFVAVNIVPVKVLAIFPVGLVYRIRRIVSF